MPRVPLSLSKERVVGMFLRHASLQTRSQQRVQRAFDYSSSSPHATRIILSVTEAPLRCKLPLTPASEELLGCSPSRRIHDHQERSFASYRTAFHAPHEKYHSFILHLRIETRFLPSGRAPVGKLLRNCCNEETAANRKNCSGRRIPWLKNCIPEPDKHQCVRDHDCTAVAWLPFTQATTRVLRHHIESSLASRLQRAGGSVLRPANTNIIHRPTRVHHCSSTCDGP